MINERRFAIFVVLLLAVSLGLWWLRPTPTPMAPETRRLDDSLTATKPAHDSAIGALTQVDTALERRNRELAVAVRVSKARADHERARADSLVEAAASATSAADSARRWKEAHDARQSEVVELRTTVDSLETQVGTLTSARDSLRVANALHLKRVAAVERLNEGLKVDLAKATECSLLTWPKRVRCPTRMETAVTVLVGRELLGVALRKSD